MAGDWLKMEAATPDKPEVLAITARMGWTDPDLTVGKLFRVWRWFDQHTTSGNAPGVTLALLDRIASVTGFGEAMQSVGWLQVTDAGISLPNFDRHCGKTAKERSQTAKRVAIYKSNAKGNADTVTSTVSEALPREEKRREEKKDQKHDSAIAESSGQAVPEPAEPSADDRIVNGIVDEFNAFADRMKGNTPGVKRTEVVTAKLRRKLLAMNTEAKRVIRQQGWKMPMREFWQSYFGECEADPWMAGNMPNPNNPKWKQHIECLLDDTRFRYVMDEAIAAMRSADGGREAA